MTAAVQGRRSLFPSFALGVLGYLLFVIVFGAWVRVTGSGAGCGDHWPTCNGELLPRLPSERTVVEYTHRVTSGLLGLMALALPLWAARAYAPGHPVRRLSWLTLALIVVEAGIGAGLVLEGLVADDTSASRALVVALHLGNTLLLTACATLMVLHAHAVRLPARTAWARRGAFQWALLALLFGLFLVACSGAVTALGDTLFPVESSPPPEHFLVQLRVVHPLLACFVAAWAAGVAVRLMRFAQLRIFARVVLGSCVLQLALGILNVALSAPGYLQLAHLLIAQLHWMASVALWFAWSRQPTSDAPPRLTTQG